MKIINDISSQRFTLDGIEYLKNFLSRVYGNKITIYNAYDKDDVLIENELYTNVEVNGIVYGSSALLQQALLSVIYTRATLGGIVQDSPYFNYFNNIEGFSLVGQDLTINANWAWTIQGGANTNPSSVLINIPFTTTGYHRIDIVVANANNGFDLIQGDEVLLANSPAEPSTPIGTLKVTSLVVTDGTISSPELPITGTDFVKKTFALGYSYSSGTTDAVFAFRPSGESVYTFTNAGLISVSGFDLSLITGSAEVPYSGKTIRVLNQTGSDITLKHFDDTNAEVPFSFKDGLDVTMPFNELMEFTYANGELYEVFRSWTETSLSSTITRKTATSSNLSTQDLTGFLTYVNGVTSFAIAANEHVIYEITDTGQKFLIYVNNINVGSGETALVSTEVSQIEPEQSFEESRWTFTDFCTSQNNSNFLIGAAVNGGSVDANTYTSTSKDNFPSSVLLFSGTSANGGYRYTTFASGASGGGFKAQKGLTFFGIFTISANSSADTLIRIGLHTSTTQADSADGAYLEIQGTTATFKTANNSSRTNNTTAALSYSTTPNEVFYLMMIHFDTATSVTCKIKDDAGTVLMNHQTSLSVPTAGRRFGCGVIGTITTAGTSRQILECDYIGVGVRKPNFLKNF